jgi:thermitase
MKSIFTYLIIVISFSFFGQEKMEFVNNHIIIKIKNTKFNVNNIDLSKNKLGILTLDNLTKANNISSINQIGNCKVTKTFLLVFKNPINVLKNVEIINKIIEIEYSEPDFIAHGGGQKIDNNFANFPNDTNFNRQWGLFNNGNLNGVGTILNDADVDMELAWDIETGDPNLIIAVSDSGLRMNHPDIATRLWNNSAEIANGIDDDGNGLIDDLKGWDWVNNDNNATDDHGHGSNVTGIIGCIANNNSLYTGVNWNSKIMPLKVLDNTNSGNYSSMANSIYYAVDKGAKIISMSIGGASPSTTLSNALTYSNTNNVTFVVCMMNFNNNVIYYPAGYSTTFPNVIAVGSTNPDDKRSSPFFWSSTSGSNFGNHINVVAPGNFIYGLDYNSNTNANNYWGGTSQATPLVAGIASLLKSKNPSLTPNQIRTILQNTAQDQVGISTEDVLGFDQYMGYGRVNAFNALQSSLSINGNITENQEFNILNPINNDYLEIFSKGQYSGNYNVSIYNVQGKLLHSSKYIVHEGLNKINFDFASGNYLLSLSNEKYTKVFKILKK